MTTAQPTTLPTGVVTFLLTDVADSTPMWEQAPDVMTGVIARHYEILHAAVTAHGGALPVEQGEGDSIVAAFRSGSDAVAAALAAQRALGAEPWPGDVEVAVRMALHTGEAKLRDLGNYAGETIIRTARLRALAHGGQVIASRQCVDLIGDATPTGADWLDLGAYRLKGLGRPEQVFQLLHTELAADFPPLRGPDSVTNNLPTQLTPFIGREAELAELHALLDDTRLLTVTGSGRLWQDPPRARSRDRPRRAARRRHLVRRARSIGRDELGGRRARRGARTSATRRADPCSTRWSDDSRISTHWS